MVQHRRPPRRMASVHVDAVAPGQENPVLHGQILQRISTGKHRQKPLTRGSQGLRFVIMRYPPVHFLNNLFIRHIRLNADHISPKCIMQLPQHIPNQETTSHGRFRIFRQGVVEFDPQHQSNTRAAEMLRSLRTDRVYAPLLRYGSRGAGGSPGSRPE